MPRVLLLHASVGSGHKRAAEALATAFTLRQPGEVRVEDVLDHTSRLFREAYARSYLELTDRAPLLWGYFYTQTNADPNLAEFTNNIRKVVESIGTTGLKKLLSACRPEVIICTHFLPMELLVRYKRKARLTQPVYCVITDHAAHTFWTYTEIDGYFVPDEQTRNQLIARGVMAAQISVTGIPVDPVVIRAKHGPSLRATHDLPRTGPIITLFGGGLDNEQIRVIIHGLLEKDLDATLIVVAGRNATLVESLADLTSTPRLHLRVYGHIDFVDDLITMSDLVITKAGGLIISEVLARAVPLVVFNPIPGQEEWNADYVVSTGAGVQLRIADSVPATVARLISHRLLMNEMQACARMVGRPHAAIDIAEQVIKDHATQGH
ncbi:MGDG synthase family glycosyltransferase [Candidatus Viridilinea mediisalina]|uniref:Galactosyldiacylglycerol synthase n=1 Tax=Candidatus Viridilinea mediisalina TaxID=2024553 RepID=A0A2A6REW2_9CHLR|nr:glycosyltransferase [Candidatus Viridilinea mediisalina]PDW01664.1 galactosyldiacylglycerol synthase [Candidatus Viridilinea mediisalina]